MCHVCAMPLLDTARDSQSIIALKLTPCIVCRGLCSVFNSTADPVRLCWQHLRRQADFTEVEQSAGQATTVVFVCTHVFHGRCDVTKMGCVVFPADVSIWDGYTSHFHACDWSEYSRRYPQRLYTARNFPRETSKHVWLTLSLIHI